MRSRSMRRVIAVTITVVALNAVPLVGASPALATKSVSNKEVSASSSVSACPRFYQYRVTRTSKVYAKPTTQSRLLTVKKRRAIVCLIPTVRPFYNESERVTYVGIRVGFQKAKTGFGFIDSSALRARYHR